jgi:hypothetical protein
MIAFRALAAFLAVSSSFFVRGDVTPSEPGPGSTFNAGLTCRITWQGDADSRTAWKDMAIELMSGSNLDMEHITSNSEKLFFLLNEADFYRQPSQRIRTEVGIAASNTSAPK